MRRNRSEYVSGRRASKGDEEEREGRERERERGESRGYLLFACVALSHTMLGGIRRALRGHIGQTFDLTQPRSIHLTGLALQPNAVARAK